MKINPDRFYSLLQSTKFTDIKSRQYLAKYIEEGHLRAITVNSGKGKRYAIKGEWLISFSERYKNGLVKAEKYTKAELKQILEGTIEYCNQHGITTLEELIK